MLKTKFICTLGPATDDETVLRDLMKTGMNVARINFSHGTCADHLKRIEPFKRVRAEFPFPVALMLDTKGPEIRVRSFENGRAELIAGREFTLRTDEKPGNADSVGVTYDKLARDIPVGSTVLIDDGLIELKVERIVCGDVVCRVVNGGTVSNNKSINIPNADIRCMFLSTLARNLILSHESQEGVAFPYSK